MHSVGGMARRAYTHYKAHTYALDCMYVDTMWSHLAIVRLHASLAASKHACATSPVPLSESLYGLTLSDPATPGLVRSCNPRKTWLPCQVHETPFMTRIVRFDRRPVTYFLHATMEVDGSMEATTFV